MPYKTLVPRLRAAIDKLASASYKKEKALAKAEAEEVLEAINKVLRSKPTDLDQKRLAAVARLLTSIKPSAVFMGRRYYVANPAEFERAVDELLILYPPIEEVTCAR